MTDYRYTKNELNAIWWNGVMMGFVIGILFTGILAAMVME